jgi:hypothetical protein
MNPGGSGLSADLRYDASRQLFVLTSGRFAVLLPFGRDLPERDRRLERYRVKEVGQAHAAVQADLVVPFGEGVQEEHAFLVGGGLGERRVPGPCARRRLSMASGSQTPSSVMPYSTTIRFSIFPGSPLLTIAVSMPAFTFPVTFLLLSPGARGWRVARGVPRWMGSAELRV